MPHPVYVQAYMEKCTVQLEQDITGNHKLMTIRPPADIATCSTLH